MGREYTLFLNIAPIATKEESTNIIFVGSQSLCMFTKPLKVSKNY